MTDYLPGTTMARLDEKATAFSTILPLIHAAGGLSLSQVRAITGLEGSTIQNWVKRGWVGNAKGKKYGEPQVARIIIISALRDGMHIEQIVRLLQYVTQGGFTKITESELYNLMCAAALQVHPKAGFTVESVRRQAALVLEPYRRDEEEYRRLLDALTVMVYACIAGQLQREAELLFSELIDRGSLS